jgi:Tn3 transposase DDE domain
MGVSGRAMLKVMSEGEQDAGKLADLARGRSKAKYEELVESLEGKVSEHHQWLLKHMLKQVEFLDEELAAYDSRIMDAAVTHLKAGGMEIKKDDLERLSPLGNKHFNVLGRYHFSTTDAVLRGELRPLRDPEDR